MERCLTPREGEVLRLLTFGKSNKEIAQDLRIAERTVNFHVKNLLLKFRVSTRMELLSRLFPGGELLQTVEIKTNGSNRFLERAEHLLKRVMIKMS